MELGRGCGLKAATRVWVLAAACALCAQAQAQTQTQTLTPGQAAANLPSAPLVPIVTPLRGDDLFARSLGLSTPTWFNPLRLTLNSGLFPVGDLFSGCASRGDASGNSVHGFAVERSTYLRLTPELVLHGFSNEGCAVDAGMGGGFTYAMRLGKSVWLVPSAGFYALPALGGRTSTLTSSARIDIVKHLGWGRTLNFGLGTRQLGTSVHTDALSFGGTF